MLSGVAEWIDSRVTPQPRAATRSAPPWASPSARRRCDNAAFTNMAAPCVLRAAIAAAERLGLRGRSGAGRGSPPASPLPTRGEVVVSHDGYRRERGKGRDARPADGRLSRSASRSMPATEAATLATSISACADDYIGSPMLSALYGVWAACAGDRALAAAAAGRGLWPLLRRPLHADPGIPRRRLSRAAAGRPLLRQHRRLPDQPAAGLSGLAAGPGRARQLGPRGPSSCPPAGAPSRSTGCGSAAGRHASPPAMAMRERGSK